MFARRILRTVSALALVTALTGCIGSETPLGWRGENAMTLGEIRQVLGASSEVIDELHAPAAGSDYGRYGFLRYGDSKTDIWVRFFPFPNGIVIEAAPSRVSTIWVYGAILPHPDGAAFYFDDMGVVRAVDGAVDDDLAPHRRALPAIRKLAARTQIETALPFMKVRRLRDVLDIYQALAASGLKPNRVFSSPNRS